MKSGIYIHIPFCRSKCDYCSFYSIPAAQGSQVIDSYVYRLIMEIKTLPDGWYPTEADTLYFGGGTPSMLTDQHISLILSAVKEKFAIEPDAEITLEMNPEDLRRDKVKALVESGINRIVLGVQSLDRELREFIGRRGSIADKLDLFFSEDGFTRCIDVITGIPGQADGKILSDLRTVTSYRPQHISLYLLSVESGTPLASRFIPDDGFEELQVEVWGHAIDYLISSGYNHYEISNYALPGFESVHNSKYWHFAPYAGFGAGAHSFTGLKRYSNNMTVEHYLKSAETGYTFDERDSSDVIVEFFMTALRDLRGFTSADFRRVTGSDLPSGVTDKLITLNKAGFIGIDNGRFFLTRSGLLSANRIIYEITEDYI